MKFLCDVHISYKLVRFLKTRGIEAIHVNDLPDKWFSKDDFISSFADAGGFVVISKDADFKNSHFVEGTPARLIRISLGNISNQTLFAIFERHLDEFLLHLSEPKCFIEIFEGYIAVVK